MQPTALLGTTSMQPTVLLGTTVSSLQQTALLGTTESSMQPTALLGTTVGIMLNKIFPDWLILFLLIITLIVTAYRTGKKGVELYKKEQTKGEHSGFHHEMGIDSIDAIHAYPDAHTNIHSLLPKKVIYGTFEELKERNEEPSFSEKEIIFVPHTHDKITAWLLDETPIIPWGKLALHAIFLSIIVAHSTFLSESTKDGVMKLCSSFYWVIWTLLWPLVLGFTVLIVFYFHWIAQKKKVSRDISCTTNIDFLQKQIFLSKTKKEEQKVKEKYALFYFFIPLLVLTLLEYGCAEANQGLWEFRQATFIVLFSLLAGVLSSLLGIGGGILLSPLMLELGVIPDSTAATSSFMILWTSLAATIQFIVDSRLPTDYSWVYASIGLVSSIVGQSLISMLVKKYNKRSFIVFCILGVIITSSILLATTGTMQIVNKIRAGIYLGFNNFCPKN